MRPQSPSLLCSAWSEPKIKLSHQLFSMLFARAAELPIMTLFSFGLSNAPVFEHALLTQLALVASWVSARDVPGLRKLIAYRAARPIRSSGFWLLCHHSPRPALPPKLPPNFLALGCNRQHKIMRPQSVEGQGQFTERSNTSLRPSPTVRRASLPLAWQAGRTQFGSDRGRRQH
jgi:hypothetical protein